MRKYKTFFYYSIILLISSFVFGNNPIYASSSTDTDAGFVDGIGPHTIIIDDLSYKLLIKPTNIKKGDYVVLFLDDKLRVIGIQKVNNSLNKKRKSHKTKLNQPIKEGLKKPIKNKNNVTSVKKIKKIDGVWRNY